MKIIYAPDYETLSRKAAQLIGAQVLYKPDSLFRVGYWFFPGWRLPVSGSVVCFRRFGFCPGRSVNLDEYCGLDAFHEQSYHYFMKQNLFNAVNFRASWLPDGCAKDLPGECERYEAVIAEHAPSTCSCWALDIMGILALTSHRNNLSRKHIWCSFLRKRSGQMPDFLPMPDRYLNRRLPWELLRFCRRKNPLARRRGKREILRQALTGPVTPWIPASVLQLHPDVTVVTTSAVF